MSFPSKTFLEMRRDIAIASAPADIDAVVALIDAAIASLSKTPIKTTGTFADAFKAMGDLSRAAGKLEAMRHHLTVEG